MAWWDLTGVGNRALDLAKGAVDQGDSLVNETTIKLAITGLSRSGKTVFITSMIQNLLALGDKKNSLPALTSRLQSQKGTRLRDVKVLPAGMEQIPWFDLRAKLEVLSSDKPEWPRPTDDLATISLMMTTERPDDWGQALIKRFGMRERRIKLEILDYPGEWLVDLPLLSMSYRDWSRSALDLAKSEPRAPCFEEFNQYVAASILPGAKPDESLIKGAHLLFRQGLMKCRESLGLQFLQPGRFICPGPKGGDIPLLWFFPLDIGEATPRSGSTAELLANRFESYKTFIRQDFFDTHFMQFNRQILLVDVLTALYKGRLIFEDTGRAIGEIAKALASQKISKLAIAATKADHVPTRSRDNLASLARDLTRKAFNGRADEEDIFHAIASIDSTEAEVLTIGDQQVTAVRGMVEGKMRPYHVGEVPMKMPEKEYFQYKLFNLPGFEPRKFSPEAQVIWNVGIDKVLDVVIGESL